MKPMTKGAMARFLPSRMSFRDAGESTYVRKPLRSKLNWLPTIPSIMKKMKAKPPEAARGRINSGGAVLGFRNIPPKRKIIMIGDNNMSFASGARNMDRAVANVTTEACSESPEMRFSRKAAGYLFREVAGPARTGLAAEAAVAGCALKCPVYNRIVVRYERRRLAIPINARPAVPSRAGTCRPSNEAATP